MTKLAVQLYTLRDHLTTTADVAASLKRVSQIGYRAVQVSAVKAFETEFDAATLRTMFDSPEFMNSLGRKFKDPMHYVVSAVRLAYDGQNILNCAPMLGWLNRLGQGLYNRQTPDGYPLDEAAWSSSGQMSTRFEIARAIGSGSAGLFRG